MPILIVDVGMPLMKMLKRIAGGEQVDQRQLNSTLLLAYRLLRPKYEGLLSRGYEIPMIHSVRGKDGKMVNLSVDGLSTHWLWWFISKLTRGLILCRWQCRKLEVNVVEAEISKD